MSMSCGRTSCRAAMAAAVPAAWPIIIQVTMVSGRPVGDVVRRDVAAGHHQAVDIGGHQRPVGNLVPAAVPADIGQEELPPSRVLGVDVDPDSAPSYSVGEVGSRSHVVGREQVAAEDARTLPDPEQRREPQEVGVLESGSVGLVVAHHVQHEPAGRHQGVVVGVPGLWDPGRRWCPC